MRVASSLRAASAAASRRFLSAAPAAAAPLARTALHDLHVALGGKMVAFAGYALPVQYPAGVLASHLHTRAPNSASLFDVGHMGQLRWTGKDRVAFLERVCVADVAALKQGAAALTLLTLPTGGILDDSIVSNHSEYGYQCVRWGWAGGILRAAVHLAVT
jgi:aminomethyltransferase